MLAPSLTTLRGLLTDETASTATEYALVAALCAIFAIAGMAYFADSVVAAWNYVSETVGAALAAG